MRPPIIVPALVKEMDEGGEGEAILSSRGFVALIYDMCLGPRGRC
jgi:hypothetical protein